MKPAGVPAGPDPGVQFARIVVAAALDSVIGMDAEGRVVAFNPAAERTFGYAAAEALGRPVADLIVPEELRPAHRAAVRRHLDGGPAHILGRRTEMPARRADGSALTVELIVVEGVEGAGGARYVAYLRDLTEQRRAEEQLRASEAQLRSIVDDQTELICRASPSFELTFCNAAHARLWGCSPAELVGRDFFTTIPPRLHAELRAGLEALTPDDPILYGENEKVFADGSVRWFEWLNRALFDARGRLTGYQSVGRDVTERRAHAEELERHRNALARSERLAAFGSLLAGVAHELNNPLSVVLTQSVLLHEHAADPEVLQRAERIRAAADRCARTIRSFLAIARSKAPSRGRVRLAGVVESTLELTAYGLRASGVAVETVLAADLPDVWGDADQLGQVAMNLVVNAEQALRGRAGPRRLRIAASSAGATVVLEVADNGPGIPAEQRSRIFDPFYTTKPVGGGTGLGLAICHGIVEAHGGGIEVDEAPGGGARFRVTLPTADDAVRTEDPTAPAIPAGHGAVLVVDDEPEQAAGLAEVLAPTAGRVDVAIGGIEALRRCQATSYAVVVSDVRMPDLDGASLCQVLRARGFAGPVILLTGDTLDRSLDRLVGEGAAILLEKPLAPDELRRAVADALAQSTGSSR
ncbi:MAG TPA: PAS domain S-box protein [Geminicoccaceae bacterium]|nr:PAS domain S-box protein [Geminicoccus sp.]HMU51561.1 PAS domain S-box protein [Geminicoccaceae bacterium]